MRRLRSACERAKRTLSSTMAGCCQSDKICNVDTVISNIDTVIFHIDTVILRSSSISILPYSITILSS